MGDFVDSSFYKKSVRYKIALVITILGLISLVSGGSYAILKGDVSSSNEQVISVGNVKVLLTENFNVIDDSVYILSDVNGLLIDNTYDFNIKNIGDSSAKIDVKLLNEGPSGFTGNLLNDEYIKVGLLVNGKEMGPMSLSDVENVIDSNILNKNEIINYKMRIWLDETKKSQIIALNDAKMFLKIKVDAQQRVKEKQDDVNNGTDSSCFEVNSSGAITNYLCGTNSEAPVLEVVIPYYVESDSGKVKITSVSPTAFNSSGVTSVSMTDDIFDTFGCSAPTVIVNGVARQCSN